MFKLLAATAITGVALFTSFTPTIAGEACTNTKEISLKEQKQYNTIIKKSKQLIEIASQLSDQEIAKQIIDELEQDIAINRSLIQNLNGCGVVHQNIKG